MGPLFTKGFSITSIRNTFKPKYLQIYSQRIVTMTTFIPSLTLPAALFANPAASILFPIALGTAVGFSVRPKETQKTYMALAPYLGWLGFATYLTAGVGHLNNWNLADKEVPASPEGKGTKYVDEKKEL